MIEHCTAALQTRGVAGTLEDCTVCHGAGKVKNERCQRCNGTGRYPMVISTTIDRRRHCGRCKAECRARLHDPNESFVLKWLGTADGKVRS